MAEAARSSAVALTRRAVEAARAGELADARQLLSEALSVNPDYEPAWMWFASVAETDAHRRFCLDRAVEAKPGSEATVARARLRQVAAEPPPEVEHLLDPPVPDDLRRSGGADRSAARRG